MTTRPILPALHFRVLGAGAGGGLPQWNCGCDNCVAVRRGEGGLRPMTQDSMAVRSDDDGWFLVNASPDILRQIADNEPLHPRARRHSPIKGILLTNGDMDHILGLFSLRESYPLALYATASVWAGLQANAMLRTLQRFPGQLVVRPLVLGQETELKGPDEGPSGVFVTPFAAPGKLPVHLMDRGNGSPEDNVGLAFRHRDGGRATYMAAAASIEGVTLTPGDVLFMDGTFWSEDEMVGLGLSQARARDMAHMPIGGPAGSLEALANAPFRRKIYTHVNNTNPILRATSPERKRVEQAGWEVAWDGMTIDAPSP